WDTLDDVEPRPGRFLPFGDQILVGRGAVPSLGVRQAVETRDHDVALNGRALFHVGLGANNDAGVVRLQRVDRLAQIGLVQRRIGDLDLGDRMGGHLARLGMQPLDRAGPESEAGEQYYGVFAHFLHVFPSITYLRRTLSASPHEYDF